MTRVIVWLVGLVFLSAAVAAQPLQPPPQIPPRDNAQAAKPAGTATLRGRVVAADSGQALRKAQVRIVAGELRENRVTSTDGDGKYEFKEVVPGRYNVSASKGSYVSLQYGQQRPFEPGKPLELFATQTIEKVDFALPRGAIITGRVLDEFGEPLSDVMVSVQRYQNVGGQRRLVAAGRTAMTNDVGEYRLYAIPPGQYYLQATLRVMGMGETDDRSGYAPTYFPGTPNIAEAQRVTVGLGQAISDMNMGLQSVHVARVTGVAVDSQGRPLAGAVMTMPKTDSVMFMFGPPAQIKPDGSFTLTGLTPGDYVLQTTGASGDGEYASLELTINGDDVNGVRLVGAPPLTVAGRVVVDPAAASALNLAALRITLLPMQSGMPMMGFVGPDAVKDDLTFEAKARPGRMRVALANTMPGWAIRSVRYRGIEMIDTGLELRPGENIADVEVELTNKLSDVSGLVTNAKGEPQRDYTAIVFPQDRDKWTPTSRYTRTARPDQDGRYKANALPPGDYYVVALDYVDMADWNNPERFEQLRSRASRFTLGEGETKSIDLRITSAS